MSTQSTVSRRPMGVFLKEGNFFLASYVFVVETHTYTFAEDGIRGWHTGRDIRCGLQAMDQG